MIYLEKKCNLLGMKNLFYSLMSGTIVTISLDNHPPVADPGGPYSGYVGVPVTLNGADSYDPDAGSPLYNHIASYEWELDGEAPYDFDEADTIVATWTWNTPGTYDIALRVTDRFGETNTKWTTVGVTKGIPTTVFVKIIDDARYSDNVDLRAELTTSTGTAIEGKTLNFYVDLNGDGSYGTGEMVGSAVTGADGWTTLPFTVSMAQGVYSTKVDFTGSEPYLPSFGSSRIMVFPEVTILTYSGDTSGLYGDSVTLKATLTDDEGNPIADKTLAFTLGTQGAGALTNAAGLGTANLTLSQSAGNYTLDSSFAGDDYYLPSSDSDPFVIVPTNTPPDVSNAYPSSDCLWPPNHQMVPVSILGVTDPDGDPVTITITSITSDEATASDKGAGSSKDAPDASGIGTNTPILRVERSGKADGRVYVIKFTASDGRGGQSMGSVMVKVPHDQSPKDCLAIDSGQKYDATAIN